MTKKIFIIIFFVFGYMSLSAQEYLTGLQVNPLLSPSKNSNVKHERTAGYLHLPFLDDFSYYSKSIFPVDSLWADRYAFINSTYAINPPTVGVATLDAINDTGAIYTYATPTPFIADSLTSLPIRLDSLFGGTPSPITAADSLYLSFYYQPQGVADAPEKNDSLKLSFYSPNKHKWFCVWHSPGLTLDSFRIKYNTYFRRVMIPITDTTFLRKGFKFRFSNYASIASNSLPSWQSNVDEWNIDYVYLNANRNKYDTVVKDISFVDPAPTILKNYTQIPARQFTNSDLKDTLHLKITNLNRVLDNISYKYVVTQENGPYTHIYDGGVIDIYPFIPYGYLNYPLMSTPAVDFTLPSFGSSDSMAFNITHIIGSNGWGENILRNDTINYRQEFNNAYAYDDGTAEAGYGLSVASAKLAYQFTFNQPDTLGGIQMFFNQTLNSPYFKYFYLKVWSSLSPETVVYTSKRLRPEILDSINEFYTYEIDDINLILNGTFYVGWQQETEDNLNVGYDRDIDSKSHLFYNVDGTWAGSSLSGSLMMRPLVGTNWRKYLTGIKETSPPHFAYALFPNPASGNEITLSLPSSFDTEKDRNNITIEMFDYMGRSLMQRPYAEKLDISGLSDGIYYVKLTNKISNETSVNKLVITR